MSKLLEDARKYEAVHGDVIAKELRPLFHVTPWIGWMNDPNGFSVYKGEIHLFYQYHPYETSWNTMYWGHVKTKDFTHWEYLPAALAPDEQYDAAGCFSGSAVELPDGRQLLMYTGVSKKELPDGSFEEVQKQCLAVGDGVNYEKAEENPVLAEGELPDGTDIRNIRDPKLLPLSDGRFLALLGAKTKEHGGCIERYIGAPGKGWVYDGVLDRSLGEYGEMWECPDYFSLEGHRILLVSPQDLGERPELYGGNCPLFLVGTGDEKGDSFRREKVLAVDHGLDFYAPQTLLSPDGRRIMIGWMQNWDTVKYRPKELPFFSQMSLPRELTFREGHILQNPVRELKERRREGITHQEVTVGEKRSLPGVSGRILDLVVRLRVTEDSDFCRFNVFLAEDMEHLLLLTYYRDRGMFRLDRSRSGYDFDTVQAREFPVSPREGVLKIRVLLDRYSAEIFLGDGEAAASFVFYTDSTADGISFSSDGKAVMDVEKYSMI